MTRIKTYLWKEWAQNRSLALGASGLFLGISFLPTLIDYLGGHPGWYSSDRVEIMTLLGGPVLAIVLGVYALGREQGPIQFFWQSRPIHLAQWVMAKYVMGLIILGGILGGTLLIQMSLVRVLNLHQRVFEGLTAILLVYGWVVLAMYSVAFVLGQWIRGIMHALVLSVGVVAMILMVPLILPGLNAWSLDFLRRARPHSWQTPGYVTFVAGMGAFSAAMVSLCYVGAKRRIQIQVDQRTIAWSTVILLLVLGAAALFPIGNNLSPEHILDLPVAQQGSVGGMAVQEDRVLVLLSDGPDRSTSLGRKFGLLQMEVSDQGVSMGEPLWFLDTWNERFHVNIYGFMWSMKTPSVAYVLLSQYEIVDHKRANQTCRLLTLNLDQAGEPVVQDQDLTSLLPDEHLFLSSSLDQDRLYVYQNRKEDRLLVFSLDDPQSPVLVSDEIVSPLGFCGPRPGRNTLTEYQIITVPNSQQNLRVTHDLTRKNSWPWAEIQGDRIFGVTQDWVLTVFNKERLDGDRIVLKLISHRSRNAIQKLLTLGFAGVIDSVENWAVCGEGLGVSVYRISETDEIERVGHYAAGHGFRAMAILPNKRVILGSDKLHVLKLPEK